MFEFRIVDLQVETINPSDIVVQAKSPEAAVKVALGVELVRSGSRDDLRARVYFQHPGQPLSMVRLYAKTADR